MARPVTRIEKILTAIKALSEDPQIDALCDEALGESGPIDKRTGKLDPTLRKRRVKAPK